MTGPMAVARKRLEKIVIAEYFVKRFSMTVNFGERNIFPNPMRINISRPYRSEIIYPSVSPNTLASNQ